MIPPQILVQSQKWLASMIVRPLNEDQKAQPMGNEVENWVVPSPTLQPHERIEIYNQQYWWRLLKILQIDYPFLLRLFGTSEFNSVIAVPYLQAYPPKSWSLRTLGDNLSRWIEESYLEKDRAFVCRAAALDRACDRCFYIPHEPLPHFEPSQLELLLDLPLSLQSPVSLFSFPYDLLALREEFLKESVDYWQENDFPPMSKERPHYCIIWRDKYERRRIEELSFEEHFFLDALQKGQTIRKICDDLQLKNDEQCQKTFALLAEWFEKWLLQKWLSIPLLTPKN